LQDRIERSGGRKEDRICVRLCSIAPAGREDQVPRKLSGRPGGCHAPL